MDSLKMKILIVMSFLVTTGIIFYPTIALPEVYSLKVVGAVGWFAFFHKMCLDEMFKISLEADKDYENKVRRENVFWQSKSVQFDGQDYLLLPMSESERSKIKSHNRSIQKMHAVESE